MNDVLQELKRVFATMSVPQLNHLIGEIQSGRVDPEDYVSDSGCGCIYGNAVWDEETNTMLSRDAVNLRVQLSRDSYPGVGALEYWLMSNVVVGDTDQTNESLAQLLHQVQHEVATR